jgi:hypothetical protein
MPLLQVVLVLIVVGRLALIGESLHPYGGFHLVNPERRGGDSRSVVAAEHLWTDALPFEHSSRKGVSGLSGILKLLNALPGVRGRPRA